MSEIKAVLDASAILAWVFNEHGWHVVEEVISESGISAVNFAEVLYIGSARRYDADDLEADLADLGLTLLPFGGDEARNILTVKYAETQVGLHLSMADRACLATAIAYDVPAVMSDGEWERLTLPISVKPFR